MFSNLRKSAQGFFAKVILFLLAGMFVLWGIGDVFRSAGGGSGSVAAVGKSAISIQEYNRARRQSNADPRLVLANLIKTRMITNETKAMGISVNNADVVDFVHSIPEFQGKDGLFDKAKYQALVTGGERNEEQLLEDIRQEIETKLLVGSLTSTVQVPEEMVQALYKTREEQRAASLLYIPAAAVQTQVQAPTDAEIKTYYDANSKKEFIAPEARTISYIDFQIADVQSKIVVPEDEIKRIYDERKDDYWQPERREVEDLMFDNEPDVKDASAKLTQGMPFATAAALSTVVNKGKTALGMVAIQDVTREAAAPIFSAKENYVTTPVMSAFRWHIYRVGKIVQPRMDTFDEARPIISRDIASRQAQETLSKLMTGFEDTMAGGVTFEQAAEKIGQKIHKAESINRDGTTVDGKKMDLPAYDNFLPTAFATQEKDHSQAVQAADGSYFMVRVDGVAPEHVRPLAEVKAQAVQGALARKVKEHLEKTAQGLSEQLRAKKKTPAEILAASGLAIKFVAAGNIKRASEMVEQGELKDKPLPHGLIGELFRINPQETTHSYVTADGSYAIATLAQVTPAPATPDPKVLDAIRDDLKGTLTREVLHSFMDSLRKKNTITIDGTRLGLNKGETSSE